jgi:RNA polymerase sigma-70 factor (ECF subfamily)
VVVEEVSDEGLMARLGKGEMSALEQLARRHQDKVLSLAYRILGRWDLAEDVAQETFLRVYAAAKRYKARGKFISWLYRIVLNLCVDSQRKSRRAALRLEDVGVQIADKDRDNPSEKEERSRVVKAAVDALPRRQHMAVMLHRYGGFSHRDISEITGWSESAVESLLVRAYANLRDKLGKMKDFLE